MSTAAKRVLPAIVSLGALAFLFATIEPGDLLGAVSWNVALVMIPALVAYGAITLVLEAYSILWLVDGAARIEAIPEFGAWTAARIKCASYLLAIVNYTLGAGALAVLLRRRAGIRLSESASIVLVISSLDLLILLILAGFGAALSGGGQPTVQRAIITLAVVSAAGFSVGLMVLRAPGSLGPLERIRSLAVFEALRHTSLRRLSQIALLRALFSVTFVALGGSAFVAFDIPIGIGELVVGIMTVAVVGAIPIAVAGLGTTQAAVLIVFRDLADRETLLAMSLILSAGMISLRALMGIVFAREFTREALQETRESHVE